MRKIVKGFSLGVASILVLFAAFFALVGYLYGFDEDSEYWV